ncbi:MAG: TonB-dependent receptor [Syntrophus sp. (in: bacteria)]|nr:TonB-dependent receptor [Syntrophus sp. (in: bacteria)]
MKTLQRQYIVVRVKRGQGQPWRETPCPPVKESDVYDTTFPLYIVTEEVVKEKEECFMKSTVRITIGLLLCIFITVISASAEEPKKGDKERERKEAKTVLEEITVTGVPYSNPITPVDTRYGTQYNLVTEEQIKEQNVYDFQSALRDVPGVMFQSKNLMGSQTSHSLYIRGRGASHPSSDFAIQFDGVPRYGALFGQVLGDGTAISTIGGIEVYKSPQPSQFGSGYASVNILPKYLTKDGQEAVLNSSGGSYGTFEQSLSGGIKKGPFDIYLSQSWAETDGHRDNSGAKQQNYYANTGYQINKEWNFRFLVNYVKSETEAPTPKILPTTTNGVSWPGAERYDTETLFTTLTLNHQYENFSGYLKGYWNHTDFDLLQELTNGSRYANSTGGLRSRQEITLYGIRGKEKLHFWSGGEILVGSDLDMTGLKNTQQTYSGFAPTGAGAAAVNGGRAKRVWDFPDTRLFSPYLAISQMVGRSEGFHITPSAGFRYYDHSEFQNKSAAQGGLVMGYGHTDLNMNYSRGVNYPTPIMLMNMVLTNAPVSNPRMIKPEVVDHYEAGLTHTWPKIGSLGTTVFLDKGKDRVQAYMSGSIPLQFNDPIGHYEIRGLELTGTATPVKDLELFAATTWLQSEAMGQDRIERERMPYTPNFQFQTGVKWAFLKHYRFFMDMQHFRGLYQGTVSRSGTFNVSNPGPNNKLDDITLVNAKVSYYFDYKPLWLSNSEIFLAINNIFNQHYEYAKGYPMSGTTLFAGFSMKFN